MAKPSTTTIESVLSYLTPTPTIATGTPVAVVWGEGDQKSPYDKNNYHAGHLSMLCAVIGLIDRGAKVTILLTSDHQARVSQGVYGPFYDRRQEELVDWLQTAAGHAPSLSILDVPTEYKNLAVGNNESSKAWTTAGVIFAQLCTEIEKVQTKLSSTEQSKLESWFSKLRKARISDSDQTWSNLFRATSLPKQIRTVLESTFDGITYGERNADMAATAYVVSRVVSKGIKKWLPNNIRSWISECGTVLEEKVGDGILVESARNMYWLRCLRLLSQAIAKKEGHTIALPRLCNYRNLADRKGQGAMRSKDRHTCVPIFAPPNEIQHALCDSDSSWLADFATRLTWSGSGDHHPIARDLATFLQSKPPNGALRNAVLDSISALTDLSPHSTSDSVRVDDWFCIGYLADCFLKMPPRERWRNDITAAHVLEKSDEDNCYPVLANRLLNKIDSRFLDTNERLFAKAVRKTVEWTDSIDLLLHMMPKRYRDHGRHQLNVAAVADLLWTASAPTEDYTTAVTVSEATTKEVNGWDGDHQLLRDMSMLAVLAHDHGYALQQVAWLLGRLESMKLRGTKGAVIDKTEVLAKALVNYVKPFASTWFRKEICEKITSAGANPCHCISPKAWFARSKGKFHLIVPGREEPTWPGHGLFGAMNLWGLMEDMKGKSVELDANNHILQALHAIAVHDDIEVRVSMRSNPLSFMLIVADEIQEWNRRLFYEGKPQVESPFAELDGRGIASKYGLQLHKDELRVRFFHLGLEKTKIDWEYSRFRNGKQDNWKRATSDGILFPKRVTFETAVGP